ncbi:unnamed protein product [Anisakis simplex]|uniref:CCDC66 domain-containing protein n=1 Tax=Anisakis simplex TaxID=6269 RepID=A0A158PNK5_ANISI|nr:unnamed protein product [Anisakis simplex]
MVRTFTWNPSTQSEGLNFLTDETNRLNPTMNNSLGTRNSTIQSKWLLQPVNIGGKLYYEPIAVTSGDQNALMRAAREAAVNTHSLHPDDPSPGPLNSFMLSQSTSALHTQPLDIQYNAATPLPETAMPQHNKQSTAPIRSASHPRASSTTYNAQQQEKKRSEVTTPEDPPWVMGNPQPRSGVRGSQSWRNANSFRSSPMHYTPPPIVNSSDVINPYSSMDFISATAASQTPMPATNFINEPKATTNEPSLLNANVSSIINYDRLHHKNNIDPAEQHKRDLLKQIEENKRRKEEEREKELQLERKEEERFEEYKRKLQEELRNEEEKARKRALAAEQNAARIRVQPSQMQQQQHTNEDVSSRPTSKEWWERKQIYSNNEYPISQSPVIPALRNQKRDNSSSGRSRNERPSIERAMSRLSVNSHSASRNNNKNDSNYDIGQSELEREAIRSRSSMRPHRNSRSLGRVPSTAESIESRVEWWEKKRGYDNFESSQARKSPIVPTLRPRDDESNVGRRESSAIENDEISSQRVRSSRMSSSRQMRTHDSNHSRRNQSTTDSS